MWLGGLRTTSVARSRMERTGGEERKMHTRPRRLTEVICHNSPDQTPQYRMKIFGSSLRGFGPALHRYCETRAPLLLRDFGPAINTTLKQTQPTQFSIPPRYKYFSQTLFFCGGKPRQTLFFCGGKHWPRRARHGPRHARHGPRRTRHGPRFLFFVSRDEKRTRNARET